MSVHPLPPRRMSDGMFDMLCDAYYEDNPSGGNLHIILDEGGVVDSHLYFCMAGALRECDWVAVAIADEMLRMPEDDRQAYQDMVDERAAARGAGKPWEDRTFSMVPPIIR